jgi:putative ABC transport system permease protein
MCRRCEPSTGTSYTLPAARTHRSHHWHIAAPRDSTGMGTRQAGLLAGAMAGVTAALAILALQAASLTDAQRATTARAVEALVVDWRIEVRPGADPATVLEAVRADPGTVAAVPVAVGRGGAIADGARIGGPAVVVGLPDGYAQLFPGELRTAAGAGHGVLLARRSAQQLRAGPGDVLTVDLIGGTVSGLRVDGIVDLPEGSALASTIARAQPPGLVVILPEASWTDLFAPLASAAASADLVRTSVVVARTHDLPAAPASALQDETAAARRIDAVLGGEATVADDLGAALEQARTDDEDTRLQLVFLPLAAAVATGVLTGEIAAAARARRRRPGPDAADPAPCRAVALEAGLAGSCCALAGLVVAVLLAGDAGGLAVVPMIWPTGAATCGALVAAAAVAASGRERPRPAQRRSGRPWGASSTVPGPDVMLIAAGTVLVQIPPRPGEPIAGPAGWTGTGTASVWFGAGLLVWRLAMRIVREPEQAPRSAIPRC